ncbi:MAG: thioredoxin family protein [Actinobacteria bacterium]|nr:thioredoxin family protein [Actinomycetota bacterium]
MEDNATLLKFYADWCHPCKAMSAIMSGMDYTEVDVESDEGGELAKDYAVSALPTLVLIDGRDAPINKLVGLHSRQEVHKWLEENGAPYLG